MPPGEQRVNGRLKEAALAQKRMEGPYYTRRLPCDPPYTMTIEESSRKGESNPLIGLSRRLETIFWLSRCIIHQEIEMLATCAQHVLYILIRSAKPFIV